MVPGTAILCCVPRIRKVLTWSNRTLSNAIDAVHMRGIQLTNTMPVDASAIPCHVVDDSNVDGVSPTCLEQRSREGAIEKLCFSEINAINVLSLLVSHIQHIVARCTIWRFGFVVVGDIISLIGDSIPDPAACVLLGTVIPVRSIITFEAWEVTTWRRQ